MGSFGRSPPNCGWCDTTPMALHQMPLANSDVLTNVPMPVLSRPMSAMRMPDRKAELVAMSPKA